jgi:hypothetical protein
MPFTDEERRNWLEEKQKREHKADIRYRAEPVAECIHCGLPFGYGEGLITDEVSLCDVCDGD